MAKEDKELVVFKEQLSNFLKNNPYSRIRKTRKGYYVMTPWNDNSLRFSLETESKSELIDALNNLILPPRFAAIYHVDTNVMELIYELLETADPCYSRRFNFTLGGKNYSCEFAESSQRLLTLSKCFKRTGKAPDADFRNLWPFRDYVEYKTDAQYMGDEFIAKMRPTSFYVKPFAKYDENVALELSRHLNFYMYYYDRESPLILVYSVETEKLRTPKQLELIETTFPRSIVTGHIDPFMLNLAQIALRAETRLRFIYNYQILEYSAFYYIDSEIRNHLLRIINTPDIHSNPDKYMPEMIHEISKLSQGDEAKIDRIVHLRCNPDIIWKEIEQNKSFFTGRQEFDGGYVMEPVISDDMTNESFRIAWHPNLIRSLRGIRNALVHGRERRLATVISPTKRNDAKIRSLIPVIQRVAEQVIIFDSIH